ncbi:MAG: cytochrome C [Geobacter sp.]|nr:MAG: cytochrome C [Geobacter sp.]
MKKVLATIAVVSLMAAATTVSAMSIVGTKHDLSSTTGGGTYKGSTTQICVFCHTPHNAVGVNGSFYPLWNRSNPAASGFKLYSSGGMQNGYLTNGQGGASTGFTADSVSLYCMSCHDGATTLGAVKNPPLDSPASITTISGTNTITSSANLNDASNSLMNDHPVNFNLTNGADPAIGTVTTNTVGTASITNKLPLYKSQRGNTSLECASCHAVHDNAEGMFLRTTMNGSLLCLGCHIK